MIVRVITFGSHLGGNAESDLKIETDIITLKIQDFLNKALMELTLYDGIPSFFIAF